MLKRYFLLPFCLLPLLFSSCFPVAGEEANGTAYRMVATVESLENPFSVNVISAEYAEGIYWLVTDLNTLYFDNEGNSISKDDLCVGDCVEIVYSGQVMLSLPPQIYARQIIKQ